MGMVQADKVPANDPRVAEAAWLPTIGPFECFGQRWSLRTTHTQLAAFLEEIYAPMRLRQATEHLGVVFSLLPPTGDDRGIVLRDGLVVRERETPAGTLGTLIWAVNRHVIDDSDRPLILHAAAAAKDGAVVVLPAPMESGKTTLVTGLLDRGWDYLTDEAAAIHTDGTVEGYPKPLSIDPGSWDVLSHHRPGAIAGLDGYFRLQWQIAPLSISRVTRRSRARLFVLPRYEEGAAIRMTRLTPSAAVRSLVSCVFSQRGDQRPRAQTLRLLAAATDKMATFQLVSGNLDEACDAIEAALAMTRAHNQVD